MTVFQAIDIAIEIAFVFPIALAAFNVAAKRRKPVQVICKPEFTDMEAVIAQLWQECAQDSGEWLAEMQFAPNPEQRESTAEEQALVDAHSAYVAQYWANVPTDNVVPFVRKSSTIVELVDWAKLDPFQLRKECQKAGIKWRGVKGGKHLSKAEMVEALGAIGLTA